MKKPIPPVVYALLLAAVAAAAGVFLFSQINGPLVADEPQQVDIASSLAGTARPMAFSGSTWKAVLCHPLLYHSLVAVPVGLAGKAPWAGRLAGLACFYATGAILWLVAHRVTGERRGPFLAVLLYALHPLAVQSALSVDTDTALMPLVGMVLIWYLSRRDFDLGRGGWLGLGLLVGVALTAKFTTPPVLAAALGIYYVAARRPRQLAYLAAALGISVILFAVYFVPYATIKGLPLLEPFKHSLGRVAAPGGAFWGVVVKRSLRLVLWLGLPFLITFFVASLGEVRRRFARVNPAVAYAAVAALALLLFYLLVGGDAYGFVKYHAPLVPLAALVLGATFGPAFAGESKRTVLFLGALAFIYYLLVVRDPLYWPYVAREAKEVLLAPPGDVNKALALTGAFIILPLVAFVVMTRRGGRVMSFVILAAAAGPALDVRHARADYERRFNYGERGLTEAASALRAVPEYMKLVVPVDVAFAERYRHPHVAVEDLLGDDEAFRLWVRDRYTGAVVLRDAYFIHDGYKEALENPRVITVLENMYDIGRYGSFTVALRKRELWPEEP
ncbi:MAG TPA: glycosyltransferase family 39 protein [bacterium]|nr:glycosyltransferase family 39 protein [bacterium]